MSDLALGRPAGEFPCPRCEAVMTVVAQIPPLGSGPGLIGYEYPKCVYVTSVLWKTTSNAGQSPLTPILILGLILRHRRDVRGYLHRSSRLTRAVWAFLVGYPTDI